jgi:DNA-binding NtrC family response regulator
MIPQSVRADPLVRLVAIDDDLEFLDFLTHVLREDGLEIVTSADPEEGLSQALKVRTDIVLLDLKMPTCSALELLERITKADPTINVILLTAEYSTESAVEAIQKGAADYLNKPISADALRGRLAKFVASARTRHRGMQLSHDLMQVFQFDGIVGWSPLMLEAFERVRRVAPHFRNILVSGDTGTGKELVARSLHRLSPVSSGPFVVCNCAAMVETLFESELFGHIRGAFSGAIQDKKGYFELAHNGTLFLDEIGDASLAAQGKLLRVLQDHVVQRVGSPSLHQIDVHVVAATNRDLRAMVEEKTFREDLYYRISPVEIKLPRLSQRREDLPLLERHFLERFSGQFQKPLRGITRNAQILLARHAWPGNVRELENVLSHACMMAQGDDIDVEDLPDALQHEHVRDWDADVCSFEEVQRRHLLRVLKVVKGHKAHAAKILGIGRTTLYRKLRESGIPADNTSH